MLASVDARGRLPRVVSAVAGVVIAIWATATLVGWDEEGVLRWIPESAGLAAAVIIALLVLDTALPIPATIVMLGSGVLLGPTAGALVNAIGLIAAAIAGYVLGRAIGVRSDEPSPPDDRMWMVAATRGLPILSESFAIGAGALGFPFGRFVQASAIGAVAAGAVYSVAGALARDHWSLVFVAAALAIAAFLIASRLTSARQLIASP